MPHRLKEFAAIASLCLATSVLLSPALGQAVKMLPQAHAHNDYLHERPLLDALDQGFGSVEADIFLVDGELQVAHERAELSAERTLQSLYLNPLKERIAKHQGSVYGDGRNFTLLIDIKTAGEPTYQALHKVLSNYRDMLSRFEDGRWHASAVTAVISGNRPVDTVSQSSPRFVGIDGRLSDLESTLSSDLMPLISDNWNSHFSWRGEGQIPSTEKQKLAEIVARAHDKQRRIRMWATADTPAMWSTLRDAGVDMINTDNLSGLSQFLQN